MTDQYEGLEALVVSHVTTLIEALKLYSEHGGTIISQNDAAMVADDLAFLLKLIAENRAYRTGLEEIVCWFGEAPNTFPDWKSCAEALADMAQNVLDGHEALSSPESRSALTQGAAHPEQEGGQSHG